MCHDASESTKPRSELADVAHAIGPHPSVGDVDLPIRGEGNPASKRSAEARLLNKMKAALGFETGAQMVDEVTERLVDVDRRWVTVTGFVGDEPMKRTPERVCGMRQILRTQPEPSQRQLEDRNRAMDSGFELRVTADGMTIGGPIPTGMFPSERSPLVGDRGDRIGIGATDAGQSKAFCQQFTSREPERSPHAGETVDVSVQRGLCDPQQLGNSCERHRFRPLGVEEPPSRLDDRAEIQ